MFRMSVVDEVHDVLCSMGRRYPEDAAEIVKERIEKEGWRSGPVLFGAISRWFDEMEIPQGIRLPWGVVVKP